MTAESDRRWLQVGEFVADFGGNELDHAALLAGRTLRLNFEDGTTEQYRFGQNDELSATGAKDSGSPLTLDVNYRATQLRPGIVLVDFIDPKSRIRSVSTVLDLQHGVCTQLIGLLPQREQTLIPLFTRVQKKQSLSAVEVKIRRGVIDAPFSPAAALHAPTDELVGRRVYHEYGPHDAYEHIYLESDLYSWHCIKGPEVGLADTDRCYVYKLDADLYLFAWIEKIIPTLGVVMMDSAALRTTGKIFGYQGDDFGATVNSPVGAVSRLVNVTQYER